VYSTFIEDTTLFLLNEWTIAGSGSWR